MPRNTFFSLLRFGSLSALALLPSLTVSADPILFDFQLVGSYHSEGLYNLVGTDTWNGLPVSDLNRPTDDQRRLAATINFFVSPSVSNDLFIQITDVVTTEGSNWFGLAFQNLAMSGIRLRLSPFNTVNLGTPVYSGQYANPGEVLFTGNGTETIPLTSTPGYQLDSAPNAYSIHTTNGVEDAFGTWGFVNGTTRIMGGGVFELTFASDINLLDDVDFANTSLESIYGLGNQFIPALATVAAASEPGSYLQLIGIGLIGLTKRRRRTMSTIETQLER